MQGIIDRAKDNWQRTKGLLGMREALRHEMHRIEMERSLYESERPGTTDRPVADREVVVSLTSYGRRVEQVYLTVESLLRQTRQPNRLILWLDEDLRDAELPAALQIQCRRGLEVRYTPDIRSYKKLIPALSAFPEAIIITADDDLIYDPCMVDRLLRGHTRFPNCIITNSASRLVSNSCYSSRVLDVPSDTPGMNFLAYGGTGTLYFPGALAPEVLDMDAAARLCPDADDIWFKAMGLMAGTPVVRVNTPNASGWDIIPNPDVEDTALWHRNVAEGRNDTQYAAVMSAYGLSVTNF